MRPPHFIAALVTLFLLIPCIGNAQDDEEMDFFSTPAPSSEETQTEDDQTLEETQPEDDQSSEETQPEDDQSSEETQTEGDQTIEESFPEAATEPDTTWQAPVSNFEDTETETPQSPIETDTTSIETETTFPEPEQIPIREIPSPVEKSELTPPAEEIPLPEEKETEPDTPQKQASPETPLRFGLGVNVGARFHSPNAVNAFVTDIWNYTIYNTLDKADAEKTISPGLLLTGKGMINPIPYLCIEPFVQGMWAGRLFSFEGAMNKDVYINSFTLTGGLNLWLRLLPEKLVSLRIGAGGFAAYTMLKVTGDIGTMKMFGYGYGGNGAIGIDVKINRIVINLDLLVPFGISGLEHIRGDDLGMYPIKTDNPAEYKHIGLEVCPGVTFYF